MIGKGKAKKADTKYLVEILDEQLRNIKPLTYLIEEEGICTTRDGAPVDATYLGHDSFLINFKRADDPTVLIHEVLNQSIVHKADAYTVKKLQDHMSLGSRYLISYYRLNERSCKCTDCGCGEN